MSDKLYTRQLRIWLTEEQYIKAEQDRKNLGLTKSELARRVLGKEFIYVSQLNDLVEQVRGYGNNLNQIAHWCNIRYGIDNKEIEETRDIKKALFMLIDEVRKLR